jgi:hypothetical protein
METCGIHMRQAWYIIFVSLRPSLGTEKITNLPMIKLKTNKYKTI